MSKPIYTSSLCPRIPQLTPDSTPPSSSTSSNMASVPFRFRRKSFSDDSSPLPSPTSSPLKSQSSYRQPLTICTTKYRPQYSLSPPSSPQDAALSQSFCSPTNSIGRLNYRLPSFKSMFGNLDFDSHLTDDEDVPPGSDFGYNPSEYDFSDSETLDDKLSPIFATSVSPDDCLFSNSRDRKRRPSASSEQEEDAVIGLLDLRRRPRFSSFPESGPTPPSLAVIISPETELEKLVFPATPVDEPLLDDKEQDQKRTLADNNSIENSLTSHPCVTSQDELSAKMEITDSVKPSRIAEPEVEDSKAGRTFREQSLPPVEALTAHSPVGSPFAVVRPISPVDIKAQHKNSCVTDVEPRLRQPSPSFSPEPLPKCEDVLVTMKNEISEDTTLCSVLPSTPTGSPPQLRQSSPPRLPAPLPRRSLSLHADERSQPTSVKDLPDLIRDSSPLPDISTQEKNEGNEPPKVNSKRRSLPGNDVRAFKKVKEESEAGPSQRPLRKTIKKPMPPTNHKRKGNSEQCRRSISPLPTCSSLSVSTSLELDPEERLELIGMVIETLAMTRASSMDGEGVWRGVVASRPNLITKRSKPEWMKVLYEVLNYGGRKGFFGTVASSGKDERNNPLPPRYFYVPEKDSDQERASLLKNVMPRAAGRRSESVKYKQYYWQPLEKWSRWDAEDEMELISSWFKFKGSNGRQSTHETRKIRIKTVKAQHAYEYVPYDMVPGPSIRPRIKGPVVCNDTALHHPPSLIRMSSEYPEFGHFSLFLLLRGTLAYAFREFYIVMRNVLKFDDGLTGYINYGFWSAGDATMNPSGELVKTVLKTLDPGTVKLTEGRMKILEIGCGLGQPAIDAVHYFGPQASITGISINQGHVDHANDLAKANSLSSQISHQVLNATEVHTLDRKPFGAAYSVEVLSEIPDPHLQRALSSLSTVLCPDAEFAFADVIKTAGKYGRATPNKCSKWTRYTQLFSARLVAKMWGDRWRTLSTMEDLLSNSGFEVVSVESVGDRVFVPTWLYAKQRMAECPDLGINFDTTGWWYWWVSFVAQYLTKRSLKGLAMLWEAGEIDYVVIKTKKRAAKISVQY